MKRYSIFFLIALVIVFLNLSFISCTSSKPVIKAGKSIYSELSPFEFKDFLINKASQGEKPVLNAGRGNPNFINTVPRLAFSMLQDFAVNISCASELNGDLAFPAENKQGLADRFINYLENHPDTRTACFLKECIDYSRDKLGIDPDDFISDMADAVLGDHYPTPPRILETPEAIVLAYLKKIHSINGDDQAFDLFATEGATAAMIYVFNSLKENFLLIPGDAIAIITPIFSPYLEIPILNDYRLNPIYIEGSEKTGWNISDSELNKLKDPGIKALFMVNPMNPGSVSMSRESIEKIAALVKNERKNLIILTDTVYCRFTDEFHDLIQLIPENCIGVFSFSKYFGVTGWRLGVIFINRENIFDKMLSGLGREQKKLLNMRYLIDSTDPGSLPFIERLLMDSRSVALAHTGGLSTPQQCIMALFSLYDLMDDQNNYKKAIQAILYRRMENLYKPLGIEFQKGADKTFYYQMIDIGILSEHLHGKEFTQYLTENFTVFDFLLELASGYQTVLLPGSGFAGPQWSVRVSMANLYEDDYQKIGENLVSLIKEYHQKWASSGSEGSK